MNWSANKRLPYSHTPKDILTSWNEMQYTSSKQMRDQFSQMRSQLEDDEQISSLMAGLRGRNIDDSDFADESVVMRLVNVDTDDPDDELPLTYSPELIDEYWGRRPVAVTSRIFQLLGEFGSCYSLSYELA